MCKSAKAEVSTFEGIAETLRDPARADLVRAIPDTTKLEIYALFKQGSIGDVNTLRPGWTDLKGRAKWDAWCGKKGMSQDRARGAYVDFIRQLNILDQKCFSVAHAQGQPNKNTMMSFEAIAEALRDPVRADQVRAIPDMTKLEIYALFKQGSVGDINTPRPGWTDLKGRAKWNAWCGKKGMGQERARHSYIDLISQLGILERCSPATAQAVPKGTTMTSFEEVVRALRDPAKTEQVRAIPDMTKLEIYAFFKQGTIGDVNTVSPGWTDVKGKAKWNAWNSKKGMSRESARKAYVDFVSQLKVINHAGSAPTKADRAVGGCSKTSFHAIAKALYDSSVAEHVSALSNRIRLEIYALFKQASIGDINTARPGWMAFKSRAKWDAWRSKKDMTQEEARKAYISIVKELGFLNVEIDRIAFEEAAEAMRNPATEKHRAVPKQMKLELYGLFKQSSIGDIQAPCPGWTNVKSRAKWEAWKSKVGMSAEEARRAYVDKVGQLKILDGETHTQENGSRRDCCFSWFAI